MSTTDKPFIAASIHFLHWNVERIAACLNELTEEEVWQRPNDNSNSVGNQLLHLRGNIRQWILTGLGGVADERQRDEEFSASGGIDKTELYKQLTETVNEAVDIIRNLPSHHLIEERPVQAFVHDGTFIILHVVEHLSYHTGQIIFWTKLVKDKDLKLYGDTNLNQTN
ncbi:putative damage-inducible protein DinB [Lewinella aquimaris]|uniref:Putative damage-inducible protein DinB n=1 Tax=Neolewinella aquimaris TaxID=1835722 RepID=A0A840E3P8_9BACT|nr:DinB family protein [Neolewinella aquimaris]MBB4077697.1 putative damage-inducible protein DinB [Neolewinella aquimaris]